MAAKKKSKGNKKESQSQETPIPTLMGAVEAFDRQMGGGSARAPVPRRRKEPRITPKFRKLR